MKKLMIKYAGVIASLALMITASNVHTTCLFIMHQPKLPEGADKLSRI